MANEGDDVTVDEPSKRGRWRVSRSDIIGIPIEREREREVTHREEAGPKAPPISKAFECFSLNDVLKLI